MAGMADVLATIIVDDGGMTNSVTFDCPNCGKTHSVPVVKKLTARFPFVIGCPCHYVNVQIVGCLRRKKI